METFKLRVKIGQHEFEAEGPEESVKAQFQAWKDLLESAPTAVRAPAASAADPSTRSAVHTTDAHLVPPQTEGPSRSAGNGLSDEDLGHVFQEDKEKQLVTLRVLPTGEDRHSDGLLLLLYGFRQIRQQHEVKVTSLKAALQSSGSAPDRIDRAAVPYIRAGYLMKSGSGKGGKYRLTNKGVAKAEGLAEDLVQQLT